MSTKTRPFKAKVNPVAEGAARAAIASAIAMPMNREQRRAVGQKGGSIADHLIDPPKDNTVWDDLAQMSVRCHQLLASPAALLPMLNNEALMAKVENTAYLNRTASVLARDMGQFTTFFQGIQQQHHGRSGASTTPDDHLMAVMLHNDYAVFAEQFEANARPMIDSIIEILAKAEKALQEAQPEEAALVKEQGLQALQAAVGVELVVEEAPMTPEQDPNVITDVEVKETVH